MIALLREHEDALSSRSEAAVGVFLLASSMVMLFIIFVTH